jgi:DNA replication and repair protein RecF
LYLKSLELLHFKNHNQGRFEFSHQINCITGANGVGKTSLLDAIHYLCTGRSFFTRTDTNSIKFEEDFGFLNGEVFETKKTSASLKVALSKSEKKQLFKNGAKIQKLSEHVGYLPVVMITPAEIQLVYGPSKDRRKFLDRVLSQTDSDYLTDLIKYNKLVESRNELLKIFFERNAFDELAIKAYDLQIEPIANRIYDKRKKFISKFEVFFNRAYALISGEAEEAKVHYKSDLNESDAKTLFTRTLISDRYAKRTTKGVHKDDLEFILDTRPIKPFGSQGQIKSFVIALHLAAFHYIRVRVKKKPLLLLDDIFEKIDFNRSERLLKEIGKNGFGQVFITDTSDDRMKSHVEHVAAEKKFFNIEA